MRKTPKGATSQRLPINSFAVCFRGLFGSTIVGRSTTRQGAAQSVYSNTECLTRLGSAWSYAIAALNAMGVSGWR